MISIVDRKKRLHLKLPVKVAAEDVAGRDFQEETHTLNISAGGVCFESIHQVPIGGRVQLEIAIPAPMRKHFGERATYAVSAVVCRLERVQHAAVSRVGARFTS